jgi:hypothetical protein
LRTMIKDKLIDTPGNPRQRTEEKQKRPETMHYTETFAIV